MDTFTSICLPARVHHMSTSISNCLPVQPGLGRVTWKLTQPLGELVLQSSNFKHSHSQLPLPRGRLVCVCVCAGEEMRDRACQREHVSVHAATAQGKARWGGTWNSAECQNKWYFGGLCRPDAPTDPTRLPLSDGGRGAGLAPLVLALSLCLWRSGRRHHRSINQVKASTRSPQECLWLVEHSRRQEMRRASLWCDHKLRCKPSATVQIYSTYETLASNIFQPVINRAQYYYVV